MSLPEPEFSFSIDLMALSPSGRTYTITADTDARARAAKRLGLQALEKLTAQFEVIPDGTGAKVTGRVEADVVQRCVVSLAPVPAHVGEDVAVTFAPPPSEVKKHDDDDEEEILENEGVDPPELLVDGRIDLGELAVSQVALGLNPYPRAPGAAFEPSKWGVGGETVDPASPFAALAKLKAPNPK